MLTPGVGGFEAALRLSRFAILTYTQLRLTPARMWAQPMMDVRRHRSFTSILPFSMAFLVLKDSWAAGCVLRDSLASDRPDSFTV